MRQVNAKFRLIFIPYLVISSGTIGLYTFLHWCFFIKWSTFAVDEVVLNFAAAAIFPAIPVILWFRPYLKLLELKNNGGKDPLVGLIMLTWITIIGPNVIAQEYLVTKTGKLTTLTDISQINKIPHTKYYKVKNILAMKEQASKTFEQSVSGKHNQYLDMSVYISVPVCSTHEKKQVFDIIAFDKKTGRYFFNGKQKPLQELNTLNPNSISTLQNFKDSINNPKYKKVHIFYIKLMRVDVSKAYGWIAIEYNKTISNRLSAVEKDELYNAFLEDSYRAFDSLKIKFIYLNRLGQSAKLRSFKKAAEYDLYYNDDNSDNFFETVNTPFEKRNGNKLLWLLASFAAGSSFLFVLLLAKPLKE